MLIACQAWEGIYQGLHGIENKIVLKAKDLEDARNELDEWGREASEELIYSYGLESEYLSEFDEDDEYADITESNYYCERGWRGFIIKEGKFSSEKEADRELANHDFDCFVKEYCESEVLC